MGQLCKKDLTCRGNYCFEWEIVNGRVKNIKVKSNTTGSRVLARCFMTRLKRFRFDGVGLQPGQVGVVRIPFVPTTQ